jgi:hypothetical protein
MKFFKAGRRLSMSSIHSSTWRAGGGEQGRPGSREGGRAGSREAQGALVLREEPDNHHTRNNKVMKGRERG